MFKIYYSDGTVYTGDPALAPKVGVQAILQPNHDKPGYHVQARSEYYLLRLDWYDGEYWQGADEAGKETYLRQPGYKVVLYGETIPNEDYARIYALADEEMQRLNSQ